MSKILSPLSVFCPAAIISLMILNPLTTTAQTRQSLSEITARLNQTGQMLAQDLRMSGSLRDPSQTQQKDLDVLLSSARNSEQQKHLPMQLAMSGWNSSGGGGSIACFFNPNDAKHALDPTGRLKREYLKGIKGLFPFDFFRIVQSDPQRWIDFDNGVTHLRYPNPGETAEDFLKRIFAQQITAYFPLLTERLTAILDRFPMSNWEAVSNTGLPYYPDVDPALWRKIVPPEKPCVYVQTVIRTVSDKNAPAGQVHFSYDKDVLDVMQKLSADDVDFQERRAILILHEIAYFLAMELGAKDANQVKNILEMVLFDNMDLSGAKINFFEPSFSPGDHVNQTVGSLFSTPYEMILASEPSLSPWPPKLTLYKAWEATMAREARYLKEEAKQEKTFCRHENGNDICLTGGAVLLDGLLQKPQEVDALSPAEAFFALAPILSVQNFIPSPEALASRTVDPREALVSGCRSITFDQKTWTTYSSITSDNTVIYSDVKTARKLFDKIQIFCAPALK